jgi:hypothetical protein
MSSVFETLGPLCAAAAAALLAFTPDPLPCTPLHTMLSSVKQAAVRVPAMARAFSAAKNTTAKVFVDKNTRSDNSEHSDSSGNKAEGKAKRTVGAGKRIVWRSARHPRALRTLMCLACLLVLCPAASVVPARGFPSAGSACFFVAPSFDDSNAARWCLPA